MLNADDISGKTLHPYKDHKQVIEEERRLKALYRKQQQMEKDKKRREMFLIREKREKKVKTQFELIYPILTYEQEFFIQDHFEHEYKAFRDEINKKRKQMADQAIKEKRKPEFDEKAECYLPDIRNYSFDLYIENKNSKGDIIPQPPKTQEQISQNEYRNQVYERVFMRMEKEIVKIEESDEEESDDSTALPPMDVRDQWIKQEHYVKFVHQADILFDMFTSKAMVFQKNKQEKEEEEKKKK